jgi:hypothetical protein
MADAARGRAGGAVTLADPLTVLTERGAGGDAAGLLKPPPVGETAPLLTPGAEAPPLVPPSQTTALPLTPALAGTAVPLMNPAQPGRGDN